LEKGLWSYDIINIRDYSQKRYKQVDDVPFGGGDGMVIEAEVISQAIDHNCDVANTKFYYMSPRGEIFTQTKVNEILSAKNLAIICGRYEGIDQRIIDEYQMKELSIGDFVLTGGELPALVIIDCCVRCLDGTLKRESSLSNESFGGNNESIYNNLLEYPLYTRPQIWRNRKVPDVLLSGHHENIEKWKLQEAEKITKERRADLWEKYSKKNH